MRRALAWATVAVVVAAALVLAARPTAPTGTASRVDGIAAQLRCPVCQGLSVKDSSSPTARSIRADVARRVEAGQSDAEIRQAYVDRYGEWVLLRPRADGWAAVVWLVPPAALVGGAALVAAALWRWQHQRMTRPSAEDRRLVEQALGHPLDRL